jgi:ubiquinone biosynthesis protein
LQRLLRLARIIIVGIRFGLDEFVLAHARTRFLLVVVQRVLFWRRLTEP